MGKIANLASQFSLDLDHAAETDLRNILHTIITPHLDTLPHADIRRKRYIRSGPKQSEMDVLTGRMFETAVKTTDLLNGVDGAKRLFNSLAKYMITSIKSVGNTRQKRIERKREEELVVLEKPLQVASLDAEAQVIEKEPATTVELDTGTVVHSTVDIGPKTGENDLSERLVNLGDELEDLFENTKSLVAAAKRLKARSGTFATTFDANVLRRTLTEATRVFEIVLLKAQVANAALCRPIGE